MAFPTKNNKINKTKIYKSNQNSFIRSYEGKKCQNRRKRAQKEGRGKENLKKEKRRERERIYILEERRELNETRTCGFTKERDKEKR